MPTPKSSFARISCTLQYLSVNIVEENPKISRQNAYLSSKNREILTNHFTNFILCKIKQILREQKKTQDIMQRMKCRKRIIIACFLSLPFIFLSTGIHPLLLSWLSVDSFFFLQQSFHLISFFPSIRINKHKCFVNISLGRCCIDFFQDSMSRKMWNCHHFDC